MTPRTILASLTAALFLLPPVAMGGQARGSDWQLGPFSRPPQAAPVIRPNRTLIFNDPVQKTPVHWEALHTFNPAAVVREGVIYVLYRAEDDSGSMMIGGHTSRLGLASSKDGLHFVPEPAPVFYPENDSQKDREWPGGCEDPRITETEEGMYVLTYTQWNTKTYDVGVASSNDLRHWTKHGPAFAGALGGKYDTLRYKSAAIVTAKKGEKLVAAKVNGHYLMYWGEGEIHLATSDDAIHWKPVEDRSGQLVSVLGKRAGLFDSGFPEVGAPPLLTDKGIIVFYNGKNASAEGDRKLAPDTYAAGEALFSSQDPAHLLARPKQPYLKPELAFERTGQYAAGTTFTEGLVWFRGRWFMYYGTADSFVGVAATGTWPQ